MFLKAIALAVPALLAYPAWQYFHPVTAAEGWRYRVYVEDMPAVSALALGPGGDLLASLELKQGEGSLVTVDPRGGRHTFVPSLSKPDGMVTYRGGIAYTEEAGERPVRWLHGQRDEALFLAKNAEGLATDGRLLYVVEDLASGARLLRFDPDSKLTTTLRNDLEVSEGVAACPDGRLFVTEKKLARVLELAPDGRDIVAAEGLRAPGALACDEAGLWIAEDRTQGARLLLLDRDGKVHVILEHLRSAQTLLPIAPGRYLLAEQGRNRILEISR